MNVGREEGVDGGNGQEFGEGCLHQSNLDFFTIKTNDYLPTDGQIVIFGV